MLSRRLLLAGLGLSYLKPSLGVPDPSLVGLEALFGNTAFARIPPGDFTMGSADGLEDERPPHPVRISRAFEIGKLEVTQAQWETVMRNPHVTPVKAATPDEAAISPTPSHFKGSSHPVDSVSWDDVQIFLQRLNARESSFQFRLPTEAEWEYAARAGTKAAPSDDLDERSWYKDNAGGETKPVGEKKPNAWGLHDTDGNVAEWVADWYGPDYYSGSPHTDPKGPAAGSYRIFRGGAWLNEAKFCRPSIRNFDFPGSRLYYVGFRLLRTPR